MLFDLLRAMQQLVGDPIETIFRPALRPHSHEFAQSRRGHPVWQLVLGNGFDQPVEHTHLGRRDMGL